MTWTKLSDDYGDDTWRLSDAAYRLHTDALVWSNRKLLDCRIPKDELARLSKRAEVVPELLETGFWEDDGDVYVIVHHSMYQRTREQVLAQQDANRRNGAKGGRPPKPGRERQTQSVTQSLSESVSESKTERDGTGRDWKGAPTRSETRAREDCTECQRRAVFHTGPCPHHAARVTT